MTALVDAVLQLIQREYAKEEPRWKKIALPTADLSFLKKECAISSDFDVKNVRNEFSLNLYFYFLFSKYDSNLSYCVGC